MADYSQYKVLIVDDIPLNILLVKKMLSLHPFQIDTAADGIQALEKIQSNKPDLVLLDLMMPRMDGFEVLQKMRSDDTMKDIKVVILSALNSEADIMRGMELGANAFVTKPVIMEALISNVLKQFE